MMKAKRTKLLSVRLNEQEQNELFKQYQQQKQNIREHCPSIEVESYKFSDYIRDSLIERSSMNKEDERFSHLIIEGKKEYYFNLHLTEEQAYKLAKSERMKNCKILGFSNMRISSNNNGVRIFKQ